MINLTEQFKIVQMYCGQGTTALVTTDVVSLKNAVMAWFVVNLDTTASSACAITPMQDVSVAGAAGAVLANVVQIWANVAVATNDTLVKATDAVNYTTLANANYKQIIFQIDPSTLTAGYDCIYFTIGALAATEALCVEAYIEERYPQATPPSAVID